jgi:D-glycero-beta-D-manno-heptose 1-phosphate adenylyltransferase
LSELIRCVRVAIHLGGLRGRGQARRDCLSNLLVLGWVRLLQLLKGTRQLGEWRQLAVVGLVRERPIARHTIVRKVEWALGSIYTREQLIAVRQEWKRAGRKVVFTNGCYDILHPGHIRLLESARSLGDVLILALNTDASVQRLKGPSRPLMPECQRAELAAALESVDAVTFFDENTPRELIAAVLPDILIKGADWAHFIAGREEVEAAGGQVLALPLEPGYSTTGILEEVLARC